jgi:hypothetical protein
MTATVAEPITLAAARYLRSIRDERHLNGEARVRIVFRDGSLGMSFLEEPRKSDRRIDLGGIHVYVARNLAARLRDRIIDVRTGDGRPRLVLRRTISPG